MKEDVILILGSSRNDGDTSRLVNQLKSISGYDSIDLNDYNISYYDYTHQNSDDDYMGLMRSLIANYKTFVFVTPVYWYAMSGIMKVFFDRITDLLDNEKELGRQLRTKRMAVITCSIGNNLGDKFWYPFIETAHYLGMEYIGNLHTIADRIDLKELERFVELVNKE